MKNKILTFLITAVGIFLAGCGRGESEMSQGNAAEYKDIMAR